MLMNSYLTRFLTDNFNAFTVGQLPRVSREDPERIRVDSVVETSVCSLLDCQQIFSFFPLSSFSFYTVQYRRVQYSTVIGQLPPVSTEDRVVSVFEPSDCLFFVCLVVCLQ